MAVNRKSTGNSEDNNQLNFLIEYKLVSLIEGTMQSDALIGNELDNQLIGYAGDDTIFGEGGDDVIEGGEGDDTLIGNWGNDSIDGGIGVDLASWAEASFNSGKVSIYFNETLRGGTAFLTRANISGEIDQFFSIEKFTGCVGTDDFLIWSGALRHGERLIASLADGNFAVFHNMASPLMGSISGFEHLTGGNGHDQLTGNAAANCLTGGNGDDLLAGLSGNDCLRGGKGDDYLEGGMGNDVLVGGSGRNIASWADIQRNTDSGVIVRFSWYQGAGYAEIARNGIKGEIDTFTDITEFVGNGNSGDTLDWSVAARSQASIYVNFLVNYAGIYSEDSLPSWEGTVKNFTNIFGGVGNDTFVGNNQANYLMGNEGDDLLVGLEGDDKFLGGIGNDILEGGAGNRDLASWADLGPGSRVSIDLNSFSRGHNQAYIHRVISNNEGIKVISEVDSISGIEDIQGSDGNDYLFGNPQNNILMGRGGNDILYSAQIGDADRLLGGRGDDFIDADLSDFVNGGPGIDTLLLYGAGHVRIVAAEGKIYNADTNLLLMTAYNIENWWTGFGTTIVQVV